MGPLVDQYVCASSISPYVSLLFAGLSRVGPLVEQPLSEVEEVLQTNVFGVVRVTQASTVAMCTSCCLCRCWC